MTKPMMATAPDWFLMTAWREKSIEDPSLDEIRTSTVEVAGFDEDGVPWVPHASGRLGPLQLAETRGRFLFRSTTFPTLAAEQRAILNLFRREDHLADLFRPSPCSFDEFWSHAVKKVKKKDAHEVYKKMLARPEFPSVVMPAWIAANDAWATWPDEKRQYIPHPSTWLIKERWNDELPRRYDRTISEKDEAIKQMFASHERRKAAS